MTTIENDPAYQYLLSLISNEHNPDKLATLFNALLTEKEQQELTNRLHIFAQLQHGVAQREISEKLGVGVATVSRGAKAYKQHNITSFLPDLANKLVN